MHFYLKVDVLLLAAVFHNYRVSIYDVYHLDPSQFVTAPSLALQAALFASKESISLISDIDIYSLFENSVRGGFVSVVKNRVLLNNSSLPHFDPAKPITTAAMLDVNSLYPTVMTQALPCGEVEELYEVDTFSIRDTPLDGDYAYALLVDYDIPDSLKKHHRRAPTFAPQNGGGSR